jgi:hypothetical protein
VTPPGQRPSFTVVGSGSAVEIVRSSTFSNRTAPFCSVDRSTQIERSY